MIKLSKRYMEEEMNSEDNKTFSVLDIKEKERQRIARDLHDVSLQNLAHLVHKVELSSMYIDKDPIQAKLELASIQQELRQVIDDMRTVVYNLHPMSLKDLGLKETIERMILMANKENKFFVETDIEDVSSENKSLILFLFRIIQECYNNAVKHSCGNQIFISLKTKNEKYIINVRDNGKGFDESKIEKKDRHFGLSIMKERVSLLNGEMSLKSSEEGTSISIEIPFQ